MPAKRWVSWAAVSSLPQAKKISLSDQKANNLAAIEKHGGVLVEHLEVPGKSRNIILFEDACRKIPAYQRLHELIKAKAFDVLVYLDSSRIGRQASLAMSVIALCRDNGITCYELENPSATLELAEDAGYNDLLISAIKATGGQHEIMKIQHRHKMGMIARVNSGKFANIIPWGWIKRYHADGVTYDILVNEKAAEAIRMIFKLYLERGLGIGGVADEMNRLGYTSPKGLPFGYPAVENIIMKPWRYAGYTEINRESAKRPHVRAKGEFQAIISDETAQAAEDERLRRLGQRQPRVRLSRFTGVAWCAECDAPLYYSRSVTTVNGKRYTNVDLRCENQHSGRHISERKFSSQLRAALEYMRGLGPDTPPDDEQTPTQTAAEVAQHKIDRANGEIERLRASQKNIDNRYYVTQSPPMDEEQYNELVRKIQERIVGLETEIKRLQDDVVRAADERKQGERAAMVRADGLYWLDADDVQAANAFLRARLRVYVRDGAIEQVVIL